MSGPLHVRSGKFNEESRAAKTKNPLRSLIGFVKTNQYYEPGEVTQCLITEGGEEGKDAWGNKNLIIGIHLHYCTYNGTQISRYPKWIVFVYTAIHRYTICRGWQREVQGNVFLLFRNKIDRGWGQTLMCLTASPC